MGLFDIFKKKNLDDGTYHRDRSRDSEADYYGSGTYGANAYDSDAYGSGGAFGDYGVFRITVQDVFSITGRGTVITGQVESGAITIGDTVTLRRTDGSSREVTVTGIEMFRKMMNKAQKGDNVGLLLRGVERNEVGRGDVLEEVR